jgi:hypothetical protein
MKKVKISKIFIAVMAIALIVGVFVGLAELATLLAGGGAVFAMAGPGSGVSGTMTVEGIRESAEGDMILANDLDRLIVKVRPSDVPLDTLTREIGNIRTVASEEAGGYEVGTRDIADKVMVAYAGGGKVANIEVEKVDMWQNNETLTVDRVMGADNKELQLYIIGKNPVANTIQVIAVNPDGSVGNPNIPAIAANATLLRKSKAMSELDAQTDAFGMLPGTRINFCQIHMTQVEMSVLAALRKKEVNLDFGVYKEQNIWEMKRAMELTNLFGVKGRVNNPNSNNNVVFMSDGVWWQMSETSTYDRNVTPTNKFFVGLTKEIFDGNNGSDTRMLLAGPNLIEYLSQVEAYSKQVEAKNTEIVHGIRFQRIETNFGSLLVKPMSGLFTGIRSDYGMVIDPNFLRKDVYEPLQTQELELNKTGQRRADAVRLLENYCLFLENLPTHRRIIPQ